MQSPDEQELVRAEWESFGITVQMHAQSSSVKAPLLAFANTVRTHLAKG